jgi:hypothetical protein
MLEPLSVSPWFIDFLHAFLFSFGKLALNTI